MISTNDRKPGFRRSATRRRRPGLLIVVAMSTLGIAAMIITSLVLMLAPTDLPQPG